MSDELDDEPKGPRQKALLNTRLVRNLNESLGWNALMRPYIEDRIAKLSEEILENDNLTAQEREQKRLLRKELMAVLRYPSETEAAGVRVMQMSELAADAQRGSS